MTNYARWMNDQRALIGRALAHILPGAPPSRPERFFIGREPQTGIDVGITGSKHLLCVAQNEAGKGSGLIINNLLGYPGSMLCFDPNLENANVTAGPCADRGFEVYVWDPFERARGRAADFRAKWNPLQGIDFNARTIQEDLWPIGEGVIPEPRMKADNAEHFVHSARELLVGAIGHTLTTEKDPAKHNLPWIRKRIQFEGQALFEEMAQNFAGYGMAVAAARRLSDAGTNEAGGFLSTLHSQTRWLSSGVMGPYLAPSPEDRVFRTEYLHRKKVRWYVGLPGHRMSYHLNCMRLVLSSTLLVLSELQHIPTATGYPTTLLLDEFGSIGHLDYIDRHLGDLRHSCRIAAFVQGLDQVKKDYPMSYEGFLQNCEKVFFGIEDLETAKYISAALGDRVWYEGLTSGGMSMRGDDPTASPTYNMGAHRFREPYWSPAMVMRKLAAHTKNMLLLTQPPVLLKRVPYWDRYEKHQYDPNPKYTDNRAT